jgi:pyridoxal phosphate enzyme (YggS family)
MTTVGERLQAVLGRIEAAARAAGRDPAAVRLVAVSKTFAPRELRAAWTAGQRAFGENYVQEALDKMGELADLDIEWHFIGPIQANKTRPIAERFHWVHSVDRLKIARRLSEARPAALPPLQICLQVNIGGEDSKSGVPAEALEELAASVAELPRLALRGLMTVPRPTADPLQQREQFRALRELRDRLGASLGVALDTLSMGMSEDLEAAVAEGATIVRVGRAIFGERPRKG